jgi:putative endonuclease
MSDPCYELLCLYLGKQEGWRNLRWGDQRYRTPDLRTPDKGHPRLYIQIYITRLVWFEIYDDPVSAISREKELKKWKRAWKVQLIEAQNPQWDDLYESIC